jgi:ribosomal protein S18 acetylase RimI-like enzyme
MPADAPAVAALWMELCRLHQGMGEEWTLAEGAAERYAKGVAAAAGNPRMIFLVAEMEVRGEWRIAGFLQAGVKLRSSVFQESVVGEIPAICVAPDSVGRGVGSALVAAAMDWFRNRGLAHVETSVAAANTPARAFFRSSGFQESASILWAEVPPALSPKAGESRGAEDLLAQGPDPLGEA